MLAQVSSWVMVFSWFPEFGQHGENKVECGINLLSHLCTSEYNFSGNENEQYNFGFHHAIYQAGE